MQVKANKKISYSGDSLIVNVTKEVKSLGLDKGDYVDIALGEQDPQDVRRYNLGRMFDNPDAEYVNSSFLTPSDTCVNGNSIEDHSEIMSKDTVSMYTDLLSMYKRIINLVTSVAAEVIRSEHVHYSAQEKSFIANFFPNVDSYPKNQYVQIDFLLEVLWKLINFGRVLDSGVTYINSLPEAISDAKDAVKRILSSDMDGIGKLIDELNDEYEMAHTEILYKELWYLVVSLEGEACDGYMGEFGNMISKVVSSPSPFDLSDELSHSNKERSHSGMAVFDTIYGPFRTKEEATKYKNYLDVSYEMINDVSGFDQMEQFITDVMKGVPKFRR